MKDGMFKGTMVNLNWTDIKALADKNALVLLPLGVIEEHGPHLCLGTDIYTAHLHCLYIKDILIEKGFDVVIAPPFYWGICQSTGHFIGSFKIRKETAKALLFDIMASLKDFGFKNIYGINAHGDIEHSIMMMEAFKEVTEKLSVNARYTFAKDRLVHFGLNGEEAYICPIEPQKIIVSQSKVADVHAGDIETATIYQYYPHLTDIALAKKLQPVELKEDQVMTWLFGEHIEHLSKEGYLGAPSLYESVDVIRNLTDIAERISTAIIETI